MTHSVFQDPSADRYGAFASSEFLACPSGSHARGPHCADAHQPKMPATQRLKLVADAIVQEPQERQSRKAFHEASLDSGQCAYSTPSTTTHPYHTDGKAHTHTAAYGRTNTVTGKTRKPRRIASQLERVAIKKTWSGTKSKGYKDRMSEAEKFSAAVWQTAQAGGHAISLNLGIRREAMLCDHDSPRRRMMQNLSRHLRDAGFKDLPYQFVFELNPESQGERLHLHGVIDTSGLTPDDLPRLRHALCRAASVASGAIGGERQIKMTPLHDPAGWADYLLEYATRTAREMGIEHPFMHNNPMTRAASRYFDEFRQDVLNRNVTTPTRARKMPAKVEKTNNLPVINQFTSSPDSAMVMASDERDTTVAGERLEGAVRQQPSRRKPRGSGHHPRPVRTHARPIRARSEQPRWYDSPMRRSTHQRAYQRACGGKVVNRPSIDMRPATGRHARPEGAQTRRSPCQ